MNQELILRILAVVHAVTSKGNVGNNYIEIIVRKRCFLKTFYLNIRFGI